MYHAANYVQDLGALVFDIFFDKILPNVAKKMDGFSEAPEEMKEAVIMKSKVENNSYEDTEKIGTEKDRFQWPLSPQEKESYKG